MNGFFCKRTLTPLFLSAWLLACSPSTELSAEVIADPDVLSIRQASKRRIENVKSFSARLDVVRTQYKGSFNHKRGVRPEAGNVPPEKIQLRYYYDVLVTPVRSRLEMNGDAYSIGTESIYKQSSVEVKTNAGFRSLSKYHDEEKPKLQGRLGTSSVMLNEMSFAPLLWAFPITEQHRLPFDELQKEPESFGAEINLFQPAGKMLGKSRWQFNSNQGLLVTRRERFQKNNVLVGQIHITNEKETKIGWMPKNWEVIYSSKEGFVRSSTTVNLQDFRTNIPTTDADFIVNFPPGTRVFESFRNSSRVFTVQEDGYMLPDDRESVEL